MVRKTAAKASAISKDIKVNFKFSVMHALILIGLIVLGIWLYVRLVKRKPEAIVKMEKFVEKETFNDGVKNCEDTTKPYSIMFFHMETCPHCIEFKPVWQEFLVEMNKAENKAITDKMCITDISSNNNDLLEKHGVSSFPTVLLAGGKREPKQFDEARTVENLVKFVKQNVA